MKFGLGLWYRYIISVAEAHHPKYILSFSAPSRTASLGEAGEKVPSLFTHILPAYKSGRSDKVHLN